MLLSASDPKLALRSFHSGVATGLQESVHQATLQAGCTVGEVTSERDVEVGAFVSTSILFLCRLDSTGRVDECRTELVSTGP